MTDGDSGSSIVRRWQLAVTLRSLRDTAGLTQGQVVTALRRGGGRWSESKLSRVENHEFAIRPQDVEELLDVYEVTDPAVRGPLLNLAEAAQEQDWRINYGPDLPESLRPLYSIENAVTKIRQYSTMVVPGLLQTVDYIRAVIRAIDTEATRLIEVERRTAWRITRQHIMRRPNPPEFHLILDEGVLRRVVGDRSIMREQLRKLVDLAAAPHMTLQILPFESGDIGLEGPFTLLTLPDPAPDIAYGESTVTAPLFIEEPKAVRRCAARFDALARRALPESESLRLLREAVSSFE
jgi:hypothetical protein